MADTSSVAGRCSPGASERLLTIAAIALEAGALTRQRLRRHPIHEVTLKGPRDYQTEADLASERLKRIDQRA